MPESPIAGTFALRKAASRSALTVPAKAIFATSSVSPLVMRRPATISGVNAQPLAEFGGLLAAAVDQHDLDAELVQHRDLVGQIGQHRPRPAKTAAQLDDEDPSFVGADIGHRDAQGIQAKMKIH